MMGQAGDAGPGEPRPVAVCPRPMMMMILKFQHCQRRGPPRHIKLGGDITLEGFRWMLL